MPRAQGRQAGLLDTWGRHNRQLQDRQCRECGQMFRPLRKASKYCSRRCAWANNGGHNKKQESWWKNKQGYIEGRIWLRDGTQVRVKQHRFVAEGILGRPLRPDEDVHHKDGNRANNDPANLKIMCHIDHIRETNSNRLYQRGYRLQLTPWERYARSLRAIASGLAEKGRAAIEKAKGT